MPSNTPAILTAEFEALPQRLEGYVMRISGTGRNFQPRALPFLARVGDLEIEMISWNLQGDRFVGYLRRVPNTGDRLFVGYGAANQPTNITFRPTGPVVA